MTGGSRPPRALGAAAVAGGTVFLVLGLLVATQRHFTGDEVATLRLIDTHDPAGIIRVTNQLDVHPPLSYLIFDLLRPLVPERWLLVCGAVLNAIVLGWFFHRAAPRLSGRTSRAWLWLALFASPSLLMWGVAIRWHALFLPVATVVLGLAVWSHLRRRDLILLAALAVAATWLSYLGLIVALLAWIIIWQRGDRAARRTLVLCALAGLVLLAPQLRVLLTVQHDIREVQQISIPMSATLIGVTLVNGAGIFPLAPVALARAVVTGLLLLTAAWRGLRLRNRDKTDCRQSISGRNSNFARATVSIVAGGALLLATAGLGAKLRNAAFLLPWWHLGLALALGVWPRRLRWLAVAVAAVFALQGTSHVVRGTDTLQNRTNFPVGEAASLIADLRDHAIPRALVAYTHDPALTHALKQRGARTVSPFARWPWPEEQVSAIAGDIIVFVDCEPGSYDQEAYQRVKTTVTDCLATTGETTRMRLGRDRWHAWRRRLQPVGGVREYAFVISWGRLASDVSLPVYPRVPLPGLELE